MRKTFTKIAGCAALGLLMCFNAPAITKAAVKTVPATISHPEILAGI